MVFGCKGFNVHVPPKEASINVDYEVLDKILRAFQVPVFYLQILIVDREKVFCNVKVIAAKSYFLLLEKKNTIYNGAWFLVERKINLKHNKHKATCQVKWAYIQHS